MSRYYTADGHLTEKALQKGIVQAARQLRWTLVYHTFMSVHSAPGFPDLVLIKGKRGMVIECKGHKGKVTEAQQRWLDGFREAGFEAYLIYPKDLDWIIERLCAPVPAEVFA